MADYFALAPDYDETLADRGTVAEPTPEALNRRRESGRKLPLVNTAGADLSCIAERDVFFAALHIHFQKNQQAGDEEHDQ
jgi:hypothetical protein